MKLALFVHDLHINIGHSNAIIEKINHLPSEQIEHLYCICFTFSPKEEIFPKIKDKVTYIKIPFPNLKPFLVKEIFYHIFSPILYNLKVNDKCKKISIGIASLSSDIVDLQFVHKHFESYFFNYKKLSGISLIYKRILFAYYKFCERLSFHDNKKYLALSSFVEDYMISEYNISPSNIVLAYSSVNQERFHFIDKTKREILNDLLNDHPDLINIDITKTIHLFVGAFERKGLQYALRALHQLDSSQIIIIGSPEQNSDIEYPENINIIRIPFSNRLNEFYNLSDHFIFPTVYEPYGLVILEAYATGMHISVTINNVGASEILKNQENVYLYQTQSDFIIKEVPPLSREDRREICQKRDSHILNLSWTKTAEKFQKILND